VRPRSQLALLATRTVNATSRRLGRGQGTVAGGRAGLAIDPRLLERLTADKRVSLVSGTNGKTTTTRLLTVALGDGVVSNVTGSNMPPGHVAALAGQRRAAHAVLEVDEIYLPRVLTATGAAVVVLLNLSRDQLDRTNEVRMVAGKWRAALAAAPRAVVVANADDPLVVWGAGAAAQVRWVGAGLRWRHDAVGCPSCEGTIAYEEDGAWACATGCGLARPPLWAWLEDDEMVWADGRRSRPELRLPGHFNRANALTAWVAAECHGAEESGVLAALAGVEEVAGRFTERSFDGTRARLMLAKNPAGWHELLELVVRGDDPLVVSINARTADGTDPSWLWDVPFEVLAGGRAVVATGERCRDLSVRLQYAGVAHVMEPDPGTAIATAGAAGSSGHVEVIGNYTAFSDLLAGRV
jgi:UDP-N-acetylmuramyl tripeptide synthase